MMSGNEKLRELSDELGQPGFVPGGGALMNKTGAGRFIDYNRGLFEFSGGFVFPGLGPNVFDRLAQPRPERPVSDSFFFGGSDALDARLMIRQESSFHFSFNDLTSQYIRRADFVNR